MLDNCKSLMTTGETLESRLRNTEAERDLIAAELERERETLLAELDQRAAEAAAQMHAAEAEQANLRAERERLFDQISELQEGVRQETAGVA